MLTALQALQKLRDGNRRFASPDSLAYPVQPLHIRPADVALRQQSDILQRLLHSEGLLIAVARYSPESGEVELLTTLAMTEPMPRQPMAIGPVRWDSVS